MYSERAVGAIEVLAKAFDDITGSGQVELSEEHGEVFIWVFGWWAWISRSSKLVVLAHRADLGHESIPSMRSIMEHSLVMQWVVDTGADAIATLSALDDERRRKLFDEVVAAGWSVSPEFNRPEPVTDPRRRKIENFGELCVSYNARSLYVPYRMLSAHVHPTAKGAAAYMSENRLADHPVQAVVGSDLAVTAVCVIQAALTINSLLSSDLLSAAITAAQERLGAAIDRPTLKPA
ncbi:hypothetical protein C8D88_102789 [Lentzea atacamensis]|uniref:Uncharacterized protein n=1 Tax=Lentzea atacamensis TaxID=531938 RepID=A0A316IQV3_9PSEU|nr:DUF5677 domain-containing protein [Lentzea atacamensis]PWK89515.1 hypothetical protein C8D88_102789 [Lentzea atacamensis]